MLDYDLKFLDFVNVKSLFFLLIKIKQNDGEMLDYDLKFINYC